MEEVKFEGKSLDIVEENKKHLKEIFPEIVTDGKIDFERLKEILGDDVEESNERYGFNWFGKSKSIKLAQEESTGTLRPCQEESKNWDTTENLYIEGDNLEVLKILQKSYRNKIKMIYIDPPYNTGKDFIYSDNYKDSKKDYLEKTEQLLISNPENSGRYHTTWLNMIYSRLYLARNLLTNDGIIFISIDDNEIENLKKVCNEIFGEENFIAQLIWENKEGGGKSDSKFFRIKHEYILCYGKNINYVKINGLPVEDVDRYKLSDEYESIRGKYQLIKLDSASINYSKSLDYGILAPDGTEIYPSKDINKVSCWRWSKDKLKWGLKNDFVVIKKDSKGDWAVYTKQYLNCDNEGNIHPRSIQPLGVISKFSTTQSNKQMKKLFGGAIFNYSKPYELIKYITQIGTDKNSTILDFFAGSSTTADAVMQLNSEDNGNRKFIMVQCPEPTDKKSEAFKVGYKTIAEIGKKRIKKIGKILKESNNENLDIGFKIFKWNSSNLRKWNDNPDEIQQTIESFSVDNIISGRTDYDLIYGFLLDEGLDLNSTIEKLSLSGKTVYVVGDGKIFFCFDDNIHNNMSEDLIDLKSKYKTRPIIVFKDNGLTDSDKTNLKKNLKSNGFTKFVTI
jgi:adenine-specific DNA-methyltransferase